MKRLTGLTDVFGAGMAPENGLLKAIEQLSAANGKAAKPSRKSAKNGTGARKSSPRKAASRGGVAGARKGTGKTGKTKRAEPVYVDGKRITGMDAKLIREIRRANDPKTPVIDKSGKLTHAKKHPNRVIPPS